MSTILKSNQTKNSALIIFFMFFVIFVYSADGHRYTLDEDVGFLQAKRIATLQDPPDFVPGEYHLNTEYLYSKDYAHQPFCYNGILCSSAKVVYSLTEVPFIMLNQYFELFNPENLSLTSDDFVQQHYVFWRNSLDSDFASVELFYGPFFSALSIMVFFMICRLFNYSYQTSYLLCGFLGLGTIIWAYSQTSLNSVTFLFFTMAGLFFFLKFTKTIKTRNLIYSAVFFGLSYHIREDGILYFAIFSVFLFYFVIKRNNRLKNIISFITPLTSSFLFQYVINYVKFESSIIGGGVTSITQQSNKIPIISDHLYPLFLGGYGLLFSPGVGLFVFCPILITVFLSFPDFFSKFKMECVLFLTIIGIYLLFFGTILSWHGLVGWGPRYLYPIIPLMLLPLGATLEQRKKKWLLMVFLILVSLGMFFNYVYLIQDVSFFIWGWPLQSGLFGLDTKIDGIRDHINIDPAIIWTFKYSQLTYTIDAIFENVQTDILLLRILSPTYYFISLAIFLTAPVLIFYKKYRNPKKNKIFYL